MFSVARRLSTCHGKLYPVRGRREQTGVYSTSKSFLSVKSESNVDTPVKRVVYESVDIFAEEEKDDVFVNAINNIMRDQKVPFTPLFNPKQHEEEQMQLKELHTEVRRYEGYLKMKVDTYGPESITQEDKDNLLRLSMRNPEIRSSVQKAEEARQQVSSIGNINEAHVSTGNAVLDAELTPMSVSASRQKPLRSQMPADIRKRLDDLMNEAEKRDLFNDEVRKDLGMVSGMQGQEQVEAMRSLAILEEIVKLNNTWNRSSSAGHIVQEDASSTILWNPEYPTKPGQQDKDDAPKLSSYFSTDTSIPGRSFEASSTNDATFQNLMNKDSVYTAGNAKRSVNIMTATGVEPTVKNVQNDYLVAKDRLKKQPKGKLHAGQIRDLLVRHQLRGEKYTTSYLAEIFDISALSVLEQIHQNMRKDVVSGAKIGGFAPLMYKLQITNKSNHFGKVLRTQKELKFYDNMDAGFLSRVNAVDNEGYVRLYGNDVIIPNGSDLQIRPLLERSLGLDRVRSNEVKKQLDGGEVDRNENLLPGIATTPADAPVTTSKPSEVFQTSAESLSYLEFLVDELVLLRGKTMKQQFDLGLCKTTPYDSPVDEDGQVSGRYSFTEATKEMHMGLTREAVEGTEANKFLYGKYYHMSRVSQRGRERLEKKMATVEETDDYELDGNVLNTHKLDQKQQIKDRNKKSQVIKLVDEVQQEDRLQHPISRYAQLALVCAVLTKYSNHNSIMQDGVNVIDDTIRAALEDGGIMNYDLEALKRDSVNFPLIALQSLCETTHVPHMYKCGHRLPGVGTFVHGHFNPMSPGYGINLGLFHPDLVVGTHRAGTNRGTELEMIDAFDTVEPVDRNGVLKGEYDDELEEIHMDVSASIVMGGKNRSKTTSMEDIEDVEDFKQFIQQVSVDTAKKEHMLQYKYVMNESGLDIAHNNKQAGIFDTYKPTQTHTSNKETIINVEAEGDKFAGHKKELFGGPVAVKTYLDILADEQYTKK